MPRDHPRSRGVYENVLDAASWVLGSSPLARGLHECGRTGRWHRRIIPARAGFTGRESAPAPTKSDHPRSRGVYSRPTPSRRQQAGSSPLARGLQGHQRDHGDRPGIIPARAGFTPDTPTTHRFAPDHPRSRGVYPTPAELNKGLHGSSPLARGLRSRRCFSGSRTRIIPARAGFTADATPSAPLSPDHPRSRGVYVDWSPSRPRSLGSSPLARGLRITQDGHGTVRGIIPARAGFTGRVHLRGPVVRIIPARAGFT